MGLVWNDSCCDSLFHVIWIQNPSHWHTFVNTFISQSHRQSLSTLCSPEHSIWIARWEIHWINVAGKMKMDVFIDEHQHHVVGNRLEYRFRFRIATRLPVSTIANVSIPLRMCRVINDYPLSIRNRYGCHRAILPGPCHAVANWILNK